MRCLFVDAADANKSGVAHEAVQNIRRVSKSMNEQEARQILGIAENATWEEMLQVCVHLPSFTPASLVVGIEITISCIQYYHNVSCKNLKLSLVAFYFHRNTMFYSREIARVEAFTFNQRSIGQRNVWKAFIGKNLNNENL